MLHLCIGYMLHVMYIIYFFLIYMYLCMSVLTTTILVAHVVHVHICTWQNNIDTIWLHVTQIIMHTRVLCNQIVSSIIIISWAILSPLHGYSTKISTNTTPLFPCARCISCLYLWIVRVWLIWIHYVVPWGWIIVRVWWFFFFLSREKVVFWHKLPFVSFCRFLLPF